MMETGTQTKQAKQSREKDPNMSCGHVKMDQSSWTELPAELLEQVLHFLWMPDLCRSRNVCKRWNKLICSPEFGKLCVLNASKSANEGACLFVRLRVHCSKTDRWRELPGCSIFDLNEKRWYNLKHDSPKGYDDVLAMNGGFVCAFVDSFTEEQRRAPNCILHPVTHEHQTLAMYNLLGGASKLLPNPPLVDVAYDSLKLKLIVDNTCNNFKIFLININFLQYRLSNRGPSAVFIYESYTDQWRNAPNPPGYVHVSASANIAVFEGHLYVLFLSLRTINVVLFSFNLKDNSWEDTGVQFPRGVWGCDLVVSDNRLFLITLLDVLEDGQEQKCLSLEISEILPAEKGCRTVVRMEESELFRNFKSYARYRAFGFNKSLLLMSEETGKVMLYNLATGQWESLPQNPLEHPKLLCTKSIGTQMNYLRLPDTPW